MEERHTHQPQKHMKLFPNIQFQSVFMLAIGNYMKRVFLMTVLTHQQTMLLLLLVMMLMETGKLETHGDLLGEQKDTFGSEVETLVVF